MYQVLMNFDGWSSNPTTIWMRPNLGTSDEVDKIYPVEDDLPNSAARELPTLFLTEENQNENQYGYVGYVKRYIKKPKFVEVHFELEEGILPIPLKHLVDIRGLLEIKTFGQNHHNFIDVDLFEILLKNPAVLRRQPTAFKIPIHEVINDKQISVMMPFNSGFNPVYDSLRSAITELNLECNRADDIWENDVVMQDVASLIDRSRVVVCDCTLKNPNVFYEIGLAHTLGRDVILIAQNCDDIPFDLRGRRYIRYLNNTEGRADLVEQVKSRISDLITKK